MGAAPCDTFHQTPMSKKLFTMKRGSKNEGGRGAGDYTVEEFFWEGLPACYVYLIVFGWQALKVCLHVDDRGKE
jgi:hypothetical protein